MSDSSNQNTCRRYKIEARPNRKGDGFIGVYEIPGKDRQLARLEDGEIEVFDSEADAIAAAGEDMCRALNGRKKFNYRHGYRRMNGADLAVSLSGIEIGPAQFAAHYGTSQKRVMQWIDGEEDIPHAAHLLIHILSIPGMKQVVQGFTNATMVDRADEGLIGQDASDRSATSISGDASDSPR